MLSAFAYLIRYTSMSKLRRWQIPGEVYHVSIRAWKKLPILNGETANIIAQEILRLVDCDGTCIFSWVVMPTHVHLLVQPKDGQIGRIIQLIKGRSSRFIRKSNPSVGEIWEKRYHDRRLRHSSEISEIDEYIIMNPVRAGLCKSPEDWPWSSIHRKWE